MNDKTDSDKHSEYDIEDTQNQKDYGHEETGKESHDYIMLSTHKDDQESPGSPEVHDIKAKQIEEHIRKLTSNRRKLSQPKDMKKSFIEEKIKTIEDREEQEKQQKQMQKKKA